MLSDTKSVIVVDDALPHGIATHAIAYLAVILDQRMHDCVRPDVVDSRGEIHTGMAEVALPILQAPRNALKQLWSVAQTAAHPLPLASSVFHCRIAARS